jgi:DNA-binding phage protein
MMQKTFALKCGLSYKNLNNFLNNKGNIKADTINALMMGMNINAKPVHDNLFMQIDENVRRKRV